MAEYQQLIDQAEKAVGNFGGLISLLLAVKQGTKVEYDPKRAAFYVDGRFVNVLPIRKELDRVELKIAALILSYNERLFNKQWTLAKWREEMDKLVESSHYIFAGLALGSIAKAVRDTTVARRLDRDKEALKRFAGAIQAKQVPSLPLAQNRGRAYIRSFYVTFQLLDQKAKIDAGFTEAKRVLTPAEHCRTQIQGQAIFKEGCYEAAARGWMSITEMPPIGTLVCGQFCKCYIIYK